MAIGAKPPVFPVTAIDDPVLPEDRGTGPRRT
ncbi:hypothetical protein JOF35_007244 [Streptomyces demainii]|uniref:Uncharacterized protein n=1 Tax=Streptomyces demainii TaxID=588122 RepID=A0ABT9L2G7_9ACTN|nr:hypothetical protein [Streptomyces demainii]